MHLIIDGYNLIRQSPVLQALDARELEAGRAALMALLADYRGRSRHKITVVFDGWQGGDQKETRDRHQGLLVIYSRRGEKADEVIKRLLLQERQRAVVVSSDREIQECADRSGATWINARQFELLHLHPAEETGDGESDAPDPGGRAKKGPSHRLPKRQRQRQQRLKKL